MDPIDGRPGHSNGCDISSRTLAARYWRTPWRNPWINGPSNSGRAWVRRFLGPPRSGGGSLACMAKKSTLTRDGYTPHQRVFGFECRWPSLLDENAAPSFAEGLSIESEVSRAHKMRITAKVALVQQDVRDKVRRAVLRKPQTSEGPFLPGTRVYFIVLLGAVHDKREVPTRRILAWPIHNHHQRARQALFRFMARTPAPLGRGEPPTGHT